MRSTWPSAVRLAMNSRAAAFAIPQAALDQLGGFALSLGKWGGRQRGEPRAESLDPLVNRECPQLGCRKCRPARGTRWSVPSTWRCGSTSTSRRSPSERGSAMPSSTLGGHSAQSDGSLARVWRLIRTVSIDDTDGRRVRCWQVGSRSRGAAVSRSPPGRAVTRGGRPPAR
jgi:hypothetical protein